MKEKSKKRDDTEDGGKLSIPIPDLDRTKERFMKWGSVAKSKGANAIVQRMIAGFFSRKLEQLRPDQLHTLLASGTFISDLIDEDDLPQTIEVPMNLVLKFMSKEQVIDALNNLITPQMIMEMLRTSAPEVYQKIVETPGSGKKWFYWQCEDIKRKLRRIVIKW